MKLLQKLALAMMHLFGSHRPPIQIKLGALAICLGWLSAGCSLPQTRANDLLPSAGQTVGWVENGKILGVESEIKVKLDTGAETSSINAEILEQPATQTEAGGLIKFRFVDTDGRSQVFERPVTRWVRIKDGEGGFFRRPVVRMKFCVGGQWLEEEVNLADRDQFNYSVLIGRNMLKTGGLLVNSAETFTTEPACPTEETEA
ncbi:ATP-dependent zinc protease family protein [Sphaerothrix gracilis]|uniref:ATP-dependent zinc protease family protein n=1 Tax=Sphaerothrix gracilis TaxID=3151835 RepID=UPI0031FC2C55